MPDGWEAVQGKLASLVGEPTLDSLPAIRLRPTTAGQVALPRSKYEARTFTQSDLSVHFVRNTQARRTAPRMGANPKHAKGGQTRRGVDELSWHRRENVLDAPLRKVVEAAGITPISLHSLRRTYENLLRKAGVDDLVRRSMAGWRSEEAQRIYANVDPEERQAAAKALVALVEKAS